MLIVVFQKGQNLEPFIQSFFNSCESPKPKPSRPELTILSPTAENNKKVQKKKIKLSSIQTKNSPILKSEQDVYCFLHGSWLIP